MKPTTSSPYCDKRAGAAFMTRSVSTVNRLIKNGEIPFYRFGKRMIRLKYADLEGYMARYRVDPTISEVSR